MKTQRPLKCRHRQKKDTPYPRPLICKMLKCKGEFRNAKELSEVKCGLFWKEESEKK